MFTEVTLSNRKDSHASRIRIAVAVMFPGLRLQQPAIPVQNATKMEKKATINKAIAALPMSGTLNKTYY